jgi:ribosomal-protein-alanine N-acetyltransferase
MWQRLTSLFNQPTEKKTPSARLGTELMGPRVLLRAGDPADWRSWRSIRHMSRDFLVPWEPEWQDNALDYGYFCGLLRRNWKDWRQGKSCAFLIFLNKKEGGSNKVIGGITLGDIQRGIAQKGTLGYWMGQPFAGKGYMTEAARLVCDFAFDTLRLHRVEASCLPHNEPSKKLLARVGFTEEGYAKSYLQINGKWQDHILWGRTKPSLTSL